MVAEAEFESPWPRWWEPSQLPGWRRRNPDLKNFLCWMQPEEHAPNTSLAGVFCGRHTRQAFLYFCWIYELEARVCGITERAPRNGGYHLFGGASVCRLTHEALTSILRTSHPLKGTSNKWRELTETEIGYPVYLQDGSILSAAAGNTSFGYTPWLQLVDEIGLKSLVPLSINLRASDRAIEAVLARFQAQLGIKISRDRLRIFLRRQRSLHGISAPVQAAPKGGRSAKIPWGVLEPLRESVQAGKVLDLRRASAISRARAALHSESAAVQAWAREADAGVR